MKQRCNNPNNTSYKYYGGKGVKVLFKNFSDFRNWAIENGYKNDLSIDRIDNDSDYHPKNCQWITQAENTRKDKIGKKFTNGYNVG
jgi:hypothetical protein